jgi:hypothetical protein
VRSRLCVGHEKLPRFGFKFMTDSLAAHPVGERFVILFLWKL